MRFSNFVRGVVFLSITGMLAGGFMILHSGNVQATTEAMKPYAYESELLHRIINWWHSDSLVAPTDFPADPSAQFIVIDLRSTDDFSRGHWPGAINLQPELLMTHLGAHVSGPHRSILLYGYSEMQSLQSVMALRLFAYQKVLHVRGGWSAMTQSPHVQSLTARILRSQTSS